MLRKAVLGIIVILASGFAQGQSLSPFQNIQEIIKANDFSPYYNTKPAHKVKIAIFDKGFDGYESDLKKYLPDSVHFWPEKAEATGEAHGKYMAEIIYALMTNEGRFPNLAPEFYFYQIHGFTAFQNAISDAMANHMQIISHSAVEGFGSNWDGQGFWNQEVNRATKDGIIWVNDAGNFARSTFNSPIRFHAPRDPKGPTFVNLPDRENSVSFTCNAPAGAPGCYPDIYLTWNDFKNDPTIGTTKDLDLVVTDSGLTTPLLISNLKQVATKLGPNQDLATGESSYPREHVFDKSHPLASGTYYIEVSSPNPNAFGANDRLRITVVGDDITLNQYDITENILNPADNPNVVTVGAFNPTDPEPSNPTSVSLSLGKPELLTNSIIRLNSGTDYSGSSNSTAIVAAGFGLLKSQKPTMTRQDLLNATSYDRVFSLPQL